MLQNDPHNATESTESLNCFVLDFCCGGHSFSSSEERRSIHKYISSETQDYILVLRLLVDVFSINSNTNNKVIFKVALLVFYAFGCLNPTRTPFGHIN